jgi:hypothetical protein
MRARELVKDHSRASARSTSYCSLLTVVLSLVYRTYRTYLRPLLLALYQGLVYRWVLRESIRKLWQFR